MLKTLNGQKKMNFAFWSESMKINKKNLTTSFNFSFNNVINDKLLTTTDVLSSFNKESKVSHKFSNES